MKPKTREKSAVVKAVVPSRIKLQFKILCAQQELNMSAILEQLLQDWLQAGKPIRKRTTSSIGKNSEIVSVYVSPSLKVRLKVCCMRERVPMKLVLSQLIEEWVNANSKRSLMHQSTQNSAAI